MHKVFLFGSRDIYGIPEVVVNHLEQIIKETNGDVQFIVGDRSGIDSSFHKALSSIGAISKSTIYCIDSPKRNVYELNVKTFMSSYDPDAKEFRIGAEGEEPVIIENIEKPNDLRYNRSFYEFTDKKMRDDCTFAICIWDGKSKGTFTNINVLKAQGKYVYVYKI